MRLFKHKPVPDLREPLRLVARYTAAEAARIRAGHVSQEMEDKWDIGLEDGVLLFCRSWTGAVIFGLELSDDENGTLVTTSWVSRDPAQYHFQAGGLPQEQSLLRALIASRLLNS